MNNKIKGLVAGVLVSGSILCSVPFTQAVSVEELNICISECEVRKSKAHELAELGRYFGCEESDVIIQFAKMKWEEENNKVIEYQNQIEELNKKPVTTWTGPKLTKSKGVNYGPIGKETYYNLPMGGVVRTMRNLGYSESEYPYWVRSDGCKMLGDYIIVAANLNHFPRGTILECSLGWAICADTGHLGWNHLDLATDWV